MHLLSASLGAVFIFLCTAAFSAQASGPTTTGPVARAPHAPVEMVKDPRMVRWRQAFFWSVVLLIIFVIAAGAIIRFSLRFRSYILRDPAPPTQSEDVWAMHKFPEKFEFEEDENRPDA